MGTTRQDEDDGNENEEGDEDGDEKRAECGINTTLLPLKVFNFFYFGAVGSVIPFLTVYLQHLRLTAPETGVITGVAVLVAFLVRPLLGVLGDCFRARRALLALCCLLFGGAFCSLWFLPQRTASILRFHTLNCKQAPGYEQCSPHLSDGTVHTLCFMRPASDVDTERHFGVISIKINAILRDDESSSLVLRVMNKSSDFLAHTVKSETLAEIRLEPNGELTLLLPDGLLQQLQNDDHSASPWDTNLTCVFARFGVGGGQSAAHRATFRHDEIPVRKGQRQTANKNDTSDKPGIALQGDEHVKPRSLSSTLPDPQLATSEPQCYYGCVRGNEQPSPPAYTFDFVFCLALTLISIARAFYSSANSLTDAVTYRLLGSNRHQWGRQRLWGTLGTAVVALVFTSVSDRVDGEGFSGLFLTCCCLTLLASATIFFVKTRETLTPTVAITIAASNNSRRPRPNILQHLRTLLSGTAVKMFLLKILVLGMFCGSAQNFIFWFLREMGSGQTILGACLLANCLSTVVVLRFAATIIRKLGETRTMYLALPAYVIRFVTVSVLHEPWLAVPLELLHGVTYSLLWAATSASMQLLAPPSTHASCQAIAGAVYWDMGRGVGSLVTGQLFRALGARWTFRAYGAAAALMLPVSLLIDSRWPLHYDRRGVEVKTEKHVDTACDDGEEGQSLQHSSSLSVPTETSCRT